MAAWLAVAGGASACSGESPAASAVPAVQRSARTPDSEPGAPGGVRYVAVLAAREAVDVASTHEGKLVEVLVRPGDRVTEGQVLARLDQKPMREELAMARAQQSSARALLAERDVDIAELERKLAVQKELVAGGVGAQQDLDAARFAVDKAHKTRDYARAQLAEQDARITQLLRRLDEGEIKAPFAGSISLRYRDPGTVVSPGVAVVRILRTDSSWVKFAIPPEHAALVHTSDPVLVELDSPRASLPAIIRHISPELDPSARMIFVEAELNVPEALQGELRSGLPAWVTRTTMDRATP